MTRVVDIEPGDTIRLLADWCTDQGALLRRGTTLKVTEAESEFNSNWVRLTLDTGETVRHQPRRSCR